MVMVEENRARRSALKRHFGFQKDLLVRAECRFYYELCKRVPALTSMKRVLDGTIMANMFQKTKCVHDPRPDYFHYYSKTNTALLGEFDETDHHEEDEQRLRVIAHHAGCGRDRMYVFRVKAKLESDDPVCERKTSQGQVYYTMTPRGHRLADEIADYLVACLDKMEMGIVDNCSQTIFG
jgi:hypothetical protein